EFGFERITAAGSPERSVARCAAGTACYLRKLGRIELTKLVAVEFTVGGESDVVDVEIEAHADGVGRYQVVDVTRLIESNLRVARARRKRAKHDCCPSPLPTDQLGDGVNFFRRESNDCRSRWQTRQLLLPGVSQSRQPWPADDMRAGQ